MDNALAPGQYLGSRCIEHGAATFTAALRRATVPAEHVVEHSHEGAHLILAIDATYMSTAREAPAAAEPMTLIYNPPGTVHRDCFGITGGRFLSIDLATEIVPHGMTDPVAIRDPHARFAAARLAGLLSDGSAAEVELEDLLLAAVSGLDGGVETASGVPPWLGLAVEAMADFSVDGAVTVAGIARVAEVHPVHLARMHRRHFGCTPGEALRRHRVARAAGLLSHGCGLAEVALDAGFADQSHMTRAFRREFGTTPARFRAAFG